MPKHLSYDWDDDIPPLKAPSRWLRSYFFGFALLLGGILIGPVATFFSSARLLSAPGDAVVLNAPGEAKLDLHDAGRMCVWHERRGFVHGAYSSESPGLNPAEFVLQINDPFGHLVTPVEHAMKAEVEMGFISRGMLKEFDVRSPGTYVVKAELPPGKTGTLTITKAPGPELLWVLIISIAFTLIGMGAALAGVVVIVMTVVKHLQAVFMPRTDAPS